MDKDALKELSAYTYLHCASYIKSDELAKAISKAQYFVEKCQSFLFEGITGEYEDINDVLLCGIFFRGIQNFAHLKQMTVSSDWVTFPELVDQVWFEIWDCKERLEYTSSFINSFIKTDNLDWIFDDISSLCQDVYKEYGHGLYLSPGILVEKITCNICGQDMRACEHITKNIYSGRICEKVLHKRKAVGNHILITERPDDPRCRLWPWQNPDHLLYKQWPWQTEKEFVEAFCILYNFRLDDFMHGAGCGVKTRVKANWSTL